MKKRVAILFVSFLGLVCSFTTLETPRSYKVKTVVIDAGHGGKDPGTNGKTAKEADVVLKIALELGRTIQKNMPDVKVIYTRTTNRFVELHDRAGLANKNHADLFISIHCNAMDVKKNPKLTSFYGTETYTMGLHTSEGNLEVARRENSVILQEDNHEANYDGFNPKSPVAHILLANYQSAYIGNSLRFANAVEKQFKERVGRKSRGVKQAGFVVLWRTAMPSVLVETGYLTNPTEEVYLNSKEGQTYIASGIYRAFREYKEEMEELSE